MVILGGASLSPVRQRQRFAHSRHQRSKPMISGLRSSPDLRPRFFFEQVENGGVGGEEIV
jgi:hypothetical protein